MTSRQWVPLALLALLTSGGAFWLAPGPTAESGMLQHEEEQWVLPVLPTAEAPGQAYKRLQELQPWGRNSESGLAGNTPTAWRLRGVVGLEGQRHALIEATGGKIRRYAVGDTLPLGEALLKVQADRIEIQTPASERHTVGLYPSAGASPTAGRSRNK